MAPRVLPSLRICRISHGWPPRRDGLAHHAYLLSRHQARLGHRVTVLVPQVDSQTLDGVDIQRVSAGARTLEPTHRWDRCVFSALAATRAWRAHRETPFDILHCHGDAKDAAVAGLLARRLGVPLILTLHAALSRHRRHRLVAPWVFRTITRFVVVGEHIRADLEGLRVDGRRVTVIPSGVEYDRFASGDECRLAVRRELGVPDEALFVVTVGRLHLMKGLTYLIEAARSLPGGVVVGLVGDGPLREAIARAASGLEHVRLLGSRPHETMPALLQAADIFTLPSIDLPGQAEGTPTALLEAMAAGLPVVITDSGGGRFAVGASGGGVIVPQRDPGALAEALIALARDARRRCALGALNQRWAREQDWTIVAQRVVDVYREALAEQGRSR